jgi:LPS sulfotransferase NodH
MTNISQGPVSRPDLLALIESYIGPPRIAAIAVALGDAPIRAFDAPPRIATMLFASRSGSSYAGRLLANTPCFNQFGENFAPDQLAAIAERRNLPDLHSAAQWMIGHRGTQWAFGYKAGFTILAAAAHLGFLDQMLARTNFFLLRRRDRVAQAVSLTRAELSGRFHSNQKDGRVVTASDYDGDLIARNLDRIARNEHDLADFARQLGMAAPIFHYEDICDAPADFVRSICALLDLPMPDPFDPAVDLDILRDAISEEWAARFRAERSAT